MPLCSLWVYKQLLLISILRLLGTKSGTNVPDFFCFMQFYLIKIYVKDQYQNLGSVPKLVFKQKCFVV